MKKLLTLVSLFIFFNPAYSQESDQKQHPLKDLVVLSNSIPSEFTYMIKHLKSSPLSDTDAARVVNAITNINTELAKTPTSNIMFLFKSEIYKGILNNQYMKQKSLLQASTSLLESIKHKLEKHKIVYTDFSKWTIQSIIKDFDPYLEKNFINEYQNIRRNNSVGQMKARRLTKIMKYLSPWFNAIDKNTPEEFNRINTQVIIDTIERISKKTYYFKTFVGKLEKAEEQILFKIPNITIAQPKEIEEGPSSLSEEAKMRKEQAKKDIENLEDSELSGASEEIDKIEEQVEEGEETESEAEDSE